MRAQFCTPVISRRAVLAAVAGVAVSPLAACRLGPGQRSETAPPAPVTLRLNSSAAEMGQMAAVRLPAFEQRYPHIKVIFEEMPDYGAKLFVLAAGGSLGDVAMGFTNTGQYHFLALNGIFLDHDAFVARDKYDLRQFYDLAVQAIRVNGKLYGLPFKGQIARIALFFNVDLFEKHGLRLPTPEWTYNDLAEAAVRLTVREGGQVVQWGYAGNWRELTTMIASTRPWGGDVFSPDGKRCLLAEKGAKDAIIWHYDLLHKFGAALYPPLGDPNNTFYEGQAAMLGRVNVGIAGFIVTRAQGRYRWGMVRMPKGPAGKRGGMWLPGTMSATRFTKYPQESWELVKWCCDKESGVALALQTEGSSTPGARPDVYADPRLANRPGYPEGLIDEQRRAMDEPEPYVNPWNFTGDEVNRIIAAELDKITKGEAGLNDGWFQALAQQVQSILDKPVPALTA